MSETMGVLALGAMGEKTGNDVSASAAAQPLDRATDAYERIAVIRAASAAKAAASETDAKPEEVDVQGTIGFSVETAMQALSAMREQAENNYKSYEVVGRNATRELMGRVYALWCQAKSSKNFDRFIANIRQQLRQQDITVKSSSNESGLLIRYIFSKSSDKQVHVYGRALDVAYEQCKIAPEDFSAWVENTKGGFEGIRSAGVASASVISKVPTALSKCKTEHTIETIDSIVWLNDEEYKVLVAVRNQDDTADVKDALLTPEQQDAILVRYLINKTKLEKQPKEKSSNEAVKNLIAELDAKVAEQESIVTQLTVELELAKKAGKPTQELASMLKIEGIKLNASMESVKVAKAALKA